LKEKGKRHAQRKRLYPVRNKNSQLGKQRIARKTRGNRRPETTPEFSDGVYPNRAFGGDCHYRIIDGDIDAGTTAGKAAGGRRWVYVEPEPMGPNICHVHTGQQRLLLQRTPSWFVIGDG
jgi:hypothetical protein